MPVSVSVVARYTSNKDEATGEDIYDLTVRIPESLKGVGLIKGVKLSELAKGAEFIGLVYEFGNTSPLDPSAKRSMQSVRKQEERSARALGGQRQSGSGARPGYKGDGRVPGKFRIENKSTCALSRTIKLAELQKIRAECTGLEVPILEVVFKDKRTLRVKDRWSFVPTDVLEKLLCSNS